VGLVKIQRQGTQLAFAAPPLRRGGPLDEADVQLIAKGLGLARSDILNHAWCDNGPQWRGVMLASAEQVLALKPDPELLKGLEIGVVAPLHKGEAQFEVRAFFPGNNGMTEDPVTGSLNAAMGQWLMGAGLAPNSYVASQGACLARAGRVYVHRDEQNQVWVGGESVTCIQGSVKL
jgi:PhzF family phenazine biosynthesis protein